MDKYLVPAESPPEKPRAIRRTRWKRDLIELSGRFEPNHRHHYSKLIIESYSEVKVFPHTYNLADQVPCQTHLHRFMSMVYRPGEPDAQISRQGVTSVQFDSKGVYLASVTKLGCLTVHDFDSIQSDYDLKDHEVNRVVHLTIGQQLDAVRWNLTNQDEVACASTRSNQVYIFDIGLLSTEPVARLRKRPSISVHGYDTGCSGFSDIAFCSGDSSRLLASDTDGSINIWDRRAGNFPCLVLSKNSTGSLNSIKLSRDNEIIYGAGKQGTIYMWDLRGGRSSGAFGNQKEGYFSPLAAVKLAHELEKISSLKAQSNIVPKEIHSIDIDPSCPYQLAFHLDDGWSGVLDINKLHVTQLHCPPHPWLDETNDWANISHLRKPCWLPMNSIYVAGSSSGDGVYLLDFYPDHSSACHVDYNEDIQKPDDTTNQHAQNRLLKVREGVTACAAHPLNGTIVAGTKLSSLILISQTKASC